MTSSSMPVWLEKVIGRKIPPSTPWILALAPSGSLSSLVDFLEFGFCLLPYLGFAFAWLPLSLTLSLMDLPCLVLGLGFSFMEFLHVFGLSSSFRVLVLPAFPPRAFRIASLAAGHTNHLGFF